MLKKILTTTYLLALTATPAQAFPIWATAIARSQCEYLAMGIEWKPSLEQALRDNRHWLEEFTNSSVAATAIVHAAHEICPNLYHRAFQEHERQKPQPTYNRDALRNL